jgi:hypothetical protein
VTFVSSDSPGLRAFEKALSNLVMDFIQTDTATFEEIKVALGHELEDMTFDECERCDGDGIYWSCAETGECDPDGCDRECDCQTT